jgi:hypothetical protein
MFLNFRFIISIDFLRWIVGKNAVISQIKLYCYRNPIVIFLIHLQPKLSSAMPFLFFSCCSFTFFDLAI